MSYSFSVRGASKEEAWDLARSALEKIIISQPVHTRDKLVALTHVTSLCALIVDPDAFQDVIISMNGSVSWNDKALTGVSSSANVYLTPK